ncbi:MAG TPA: cation transporter [Dehalococcoidia bacterium]
MNSVGAESGSRRLSVLLLWLTISWNVIEGVIAVSSGVAAGSVALIGFGLDSFIEVTAAGVLLWRLGLPEQDERAERREAAAHRVVGITFLLLATYIGAQAVYTLTVGDEPDVSAVGLALAIISLAIMPGLGLTKRWNARKLGSRALIAESTETLICSYLSFTLFIGLGANAAFGWWWADIAAALAMVPWIVKEGLEGFRGEACEEGGT